MRKLSECYGLFIQGEVLTDEECIALRDQFKTVADSLMALGQIFPLAYKEATYQHIALEDICRARGI